MNQILLCLWILAGSVMFILPFLDGLKQVSSMWKTEEKKGNAMRDYI